MNAFIDPVDRELALAGELPPLERLQRDPRYQWRWQVLQQMLAVSEDGPEPLEEGAARDLMPTMARQLVAGDAPSTDPATQRFYAALAVDDDLHADFLCELDVAFAATRFVAPPAPAFAELVQGLELARPPVGFSSAVGQLAAAVRTDVLEWKSSARRLVQQVRSFVAGSMPPPTFALAPATLRGGEAHEPATDDGTQIVDLPTAGAVSVRLKAGPLEDAEELGQLTVIVRRQGPDASARLLVRVVPATADAATGLPDPLCTFELEPGRVEAQATIARSESDWDFTRGRIEIDTLP